MLLAVVEGVPMRANHRDRLIMEQSIGSADAAGFVDWQFEVVAVGCFPACFAKE